jgi:hypothetical protein
MLLNQAVWAPRARRSRVQHCILADHGPYRCAAPGADDGRLRGVGVWGVCGRVWDPETGACLHVIDKYQSNLK